MGYFIGIDSSTTATKALLMDVTGKVCGVASTEYNYETPYPLWSEQSPDLWWEATISSIRRLIQSTGIMQQEVQGIGLTGQMHGLVILDKDHKILRPAILWNDQRTSSQCDVIRERFGRTRLIQVTGNDALTGFTAPKILWVQEEEPDVYNQIAHILLPKDYVRFKLTDKFAMDRAGGSGTILFDLRKRSWSTELLETLNIDPNWLPDTYEGTESTGVITEKAADLTGLASGTPVFGGGGDQAAGAVGVGAVVEGVVSLSLGTSGVVFATTNSPVIESDGRLHAFCHALPGKWHLMGVMLSAAGSLRWFRDSFAGDMSYDALLAHVGEIPPGSEGLYFLPYLTGERTPHPDPLARGAFVGLTVRHNLDHMVRAVLEGVAFGLKDSFQLMDEAGLANVEQVRITGGGAKSPVWRQVLADILDVELVTVNTSESAAFGAALLAATGTGAFQDVEKACKATIRVTGSIKPGSARLTYQNKYPLYRELYPALQKSFAAIGLLEQ